MAKLGQERRFNTIVWQKLNQIGQINMVLPIFG